MKKVLFIIPSLAGGGAERQAVTVARLLVTKGYNVSFVCYSKEDFYYSLLNESGIRVFINECNYFKRVLFVVRTIHSGHYKAVISFLPTPNFLNCLASFINKKWQTIISERSSDESVFHIRRDRFYSWFYRKADAIVCNSDNARSLWIKYYPNYTNRLLTIYNTVSLGKIDTAYIPRKCGRLNIVVAATVYELKNPMGLVNAVRLMSREERDLLHVFWYGKKEAMIGDHAEYDRVKYAIEDEHLEDVITLHDATRDIADRMYEADCVALFSKIEGMPNAICEGMMLGKPIIMTRVSDYSTIVEDGVNGFLCDWDNPNSIKNALLSMSSIDNERLVQMGANSKDKAEVLFSEESIINKWIAIIDAQR